jgi:hypothetical protein
MEDHQGAKSDNSRKTNDCERNNQGVFITFNGKNRQKNTNCGEEKKKSQLYSCVKIEERKCKNAKGGTEGQQREPWKLHSHHKNPELKRAEPQNAEFQ